MSTTTTHTHDEHSLCFRADHSDGRPVSEAETVRVLTIYADHDSVITHELRYVAGASSTLCGASTYGLSASSTVLRSAGLVTCAGCLAQADVAVPVVGEQVVVVHVDAGVVQPSFIGTVVRYWRNGQWIVREPRYGTTCAYPAAELSPVDAGEASA